MISVVVQEDEHGEPYIELPRSLIKDLGWDENTELVWTVHDDGQVGLRRRTDIE